MGHVYQLPSNQPAAKSKATDTKPSTPMPDAATKTTSSTSKNEELSLERAAEEAFMIHMRHGGEFIDENPITGRPGEFHLSSTGRKPVLPPSQPAQQPAIGAMNGPTINTKLDDKKDATSEKTPKSATMPKPKRRKSRMGTATPAATPGATPSAS